MPWKILTFLFPIIFLFIIQTKAKINEAYELHFEYRNDEIDYDSINKNFYRGRIKLSPSKKSIFNLSYMHIQSNSENRVTWYLAMKDISKNFSFIVGNFHTNFGSGLIIGKKQAFSRDEFATGLILSFNKRFKPSNSGNPLYSFNGIAATYQYLFTDIIISINSFFSIRNRYINIDDYEIKKIKSSIFSINNYNINTYNHSEPILTFDKGTMMEVLLFSRILFQTYFIHANMKDTNGHKISWSHDKNNWSQCIEYYYTWGFFINYFDDYLDIFIEFGLPVKKIKPEKYNNKPIEKYGVVYGFSYSNDIFSISIVGKNCGKNFSAPYSSGTTYALDQWIIKISITPLRSIRISGIYSIEKKLIPTGYENILPSSQKEELSFGYNHKVIGGFKIFCSFIQKEVENGKEEKLRMRNKLYFNILYFSKISLRGTFQKKQKNYSGSLNIELNFFYKKYFKIKSQYTRYFISEDNFIYSSTSSFYNSISTGFISQKNSNLITIGFTGKYKFFTLILQYNNRFIINTVINQKFETSIKACF